MSDLEHLKNLRLAELDLVRGHFTPGARVLEIGAGAGWQARRLSEMGVSVEAIDLPSSRYAAERAWPVRDYDGRHIPFPPGHFRIVFSSNVLEHIEEVAEFQTEIQRVLEEEGVAIHLMPTASWRFWTNVARLLLPLKWVVGRLATKRLPIAEGSSSGTPRPSSSPLGRSWRRNGLTGLLWKAIVPPAHGAVGNGLTELYWFSRYRWLSLFGRTGWRRRNHRSNRLFYTGYSLLGPRLSIPTRRRLSYLLGGACRVYVLALGSR